MQSIILINILHFVSQKTQEIALYDVVTNLFDVVITDYKYLKFTN